MQAHARSSVPSAMPDLPKESPSESMAPPVAIANSKTLIHASSSRVVRMLPRDLFLPVTSISDDL